MMSAFDLILGAVVLLLAAWCVTEAIFADDVVICNVCKYSGRFKKNEYGEEYADCPFMRVPIEFDDYCSWGERKDEE